MTKEEREEAIKILQSAIKKPNTKDGYLGQAIERAINAIKMKDKVEAALLEIAENIEPKCINDSSDKYGSISHYQRGLYDAAQIILKHVGEDLEQ